MRLNSSLHVSGIYQIKNLVDGKIYIGSSVDIYRRFNMHLSQLRHSHHDNRYLQRAWEKHGEPNFEFSVLEQADGETLRDREQYYLDALRPEYNMAKDVDPRTHLSAQWKNPEFRERRKKTIQTNFVSGKPRKNGVQDAAMERHIQLLYSEGVPIKDIQEMFHVGSNTVRRCIRRVPFLAV